MTLTNPQKDFLTNNLYPNLLTNFQQKYPNLSQADKLATLDFLFEGYADEEGMLGYLNWFTTLNELYDFVDQRIGVLAPYFNADILDSIFYNAETLTTEDIFHFLNLQPTDQPNRIYQSPVNDIGEYLKLEVKLDFNNPLSGLQDLLLKAITKDAPI